MSKTFSKKSLRGKFPRQIVYEDDLVLAIRDINPQAPTHVLIFPKKVIPRIGEAQAGDRELLGHILLKAAEVAKKLDLKSGYRLVINNGADGGETVPHLHVHILGGRHMAWPPG